MTGIVDRDPWNVFNSNVPPSARSMIVNGLRPARYFQVIISAVNSVGEGSPSDPKPVPPIRMPEQGEKFIPKHSLISMNCLTQNVKERKKILYKY